MLHHANILAEAKNKTFSQDYRERTGRFFTPPQWVKLSQKYIADALGENWQEEYYVWDCAAGTGNLLEGLTNPYNIWASTIDQADVDVMKERSAKGANLLENHIFQFDFLNDSFDKLPDPLREIVNNPEKRKKLLIYINPPYAEAGNRKTPMGTGENRNDIAKGSKIAEKYGNVIGSARNELFALFLIRIHKEICPRIIAHFSTPKILQSPGFGKFRHEFTAQLKKLFMIPANTFDNVKGEFPIIFCLWNTDNTTKIVEEMYISADVYDKSAKCLGIKNIFCPHSNKLINNWMTLYKDNTHSCLGYLHYTGSDFLNQKSVFIMFKRNVGHYSINAITLNNLLECSLYYTVRHILPATWINNHDQFLYPNDSWETDRQFQTDCLTYTLFSNKNNISLKHGINHWIPFTEMEVRPKDNFASHFMTDYIQGTITMNPEEKQALVEKNQKSSLPSAPLEFSPAAQAVFDAGRELWKYYHSKPDANPNAALYDIKEYFQGRNDKGRIKTKSNDEEYNRLMGILREKLKILADQIEPKVYEHGFLKK